MTDATTAHGKRWVFWLTAFVLFFVFLFLIRGILLPFVLGMGAAYLLDPAADRLERIGLSRGLATLLITICFFACICALLLLVVPVIASQLSGLIAALPGYITAFEQQYTPQLTRWLGDLPGTDMDTVKTSLGNLSGLMIKLAGEVLAGLFQSGRAVFNVLSLILITPIVAFYLLRDWDRLTARLDRLLPRPHADVIRAQLHLIDRTLAGFVRGQLTVCLSLAIYYALAFSLIGLKFGAVIGIMTGLLIIFPYIGALVGIATALGVAFFQSPTYGEIGSVLLIYLVGQTMEAYILTPKLVGERVGLHPAWLIFGMLSGAALFGFVGVLLAVPVTAVIGVLVRFALERYLQSAYYQGESH